EAPAGLDDIVANAPADAPDQHFDGVGLALEVLVVEVVDDLHARDDAATLVRQIGEQPVFLRWQADRHALARHLHQPRIEHQIADLDAGRRQPPGTPDDGAQPGDHLLDVERLDDV